MFAYSHMLVYGHDHHFNHALTLAVTAAATNAYEHC